MRFARIIPILITLTALSGVQVIAEESAIQAVPFAGIRPTDPGGRCGLRNPERGLRIETLFAEPSGSAVWSPAHHLDGKLTRGFSDDWWLLDASRYEPDGLTLAQTYCYLDRYTSEPISEEKLAQLRRSLDRLRGAGLKALLRFAFEKDMERTSGPTLETILSHIDRLAPMIQEYVDVIYVLQAGFVGAWGEWHSSAQGLEKDRAALAAIVARLLEVLPKDRMTQVRVPKYKRWVLSEPILNSFQVLDGSNAFSGSAASRIGFHDDGFLANDSDGGTWPEPPHYANPGNPEFDTMTEQSAYVPVDGELFWSDQGGQIDGLQAALRMRLHHYSSFSLAHSYSEREGKPFSIDAWMQTPLTAEQVRELKLPLSDGYFEDNTGQPVTRTAYEYIRDHLGYRLELQRARFPKQVRPGESISVEVELINRGFSVLHNPRPVHLALIDCEGNVVAVSENAADPRTWQPFAPGDAEYTPLTHRIEARIPTEESLQPGSYILGLWLPDASETLAVDSRYAVRVANRDTPWWTDAAGQYGINLLGIIDLGV